MSNCFVVNELKQFNGGRVPILAEAVTPEQPDSPKQKMNLDLK